MKVAEPETHDHEKCKAFFEYLSEYIDSELGDDLCDTIENHLKDCPCCNSCLLTLKKTIELCKGYQNKAVPSNLSERLKKIAGC